MSQDRPDMDEVVRQAKEAITALHAHGYEISSDAVRLLIEEREQREYETGVLRRTLLDRDEWINKVGHPALAQIEQLIAENEKLIEEIEQQKEYINGLVGPDRRNANQRLIAENERLKEENISLLASSAIDANDNVKLRAKVAEQDKEIQRLEGIQKLWKEINPTVYQMFELISSLYQTYLLDAKQSGATDSVNIQQWFEQLSQTKISNL